MAYSNGAGAGVNDRRVAAFWRGSRPARYEAVALINAATSLGLSSIAWWQASIDAIFTVGPSRAASANLASMD